MAKFHGKNGRVKFNGSVVAHVKSWKTVFKSTVADCTAMQNDWEEYLAGLYSWNVSLECFADSTPTIDLATYLGEGDSASVDKFLLELEFDTTDTPVVEIIGYAFLKGQGNKQNQKDAAAVAYEFQGIPSTVGVGPSEEEEAE